MRIWRVVLGVQPLWWQRGNLKRQSKVNLVPLDCFVSSVTTFFLSYEFISDGDHIRPVMESHLQMLSVRGGWREPAVSVKEYYGIHFSMHGNLKPLPYTPPKHRHAHTATLNTSFMRISMTTASTGRILWSVFSFGRDIITGYLVLWSVGEGCARVGRHDNHLYISLICNYGMWCLALPIPRKKLHMYLNMRL